MTYRVEYPGKPAHMLDSGIVKQGPGILRRVVIHRAPSVGGYLNFCDGDNGMSPVLFTLTLDMAESISIQPISLEYNIEFHDGLYVLFGGGITGADIVVVFN